MAEERNSDSRLHRFFDGDLPPEEAAEMRRSIADDPSLGAKLDGLREVGRVVRAAAIGDAEIPSDELWAKIDAALPVDRGIEEKSKASPKAEREHARPLRVLEGGQGTISSVRPPHSDEGRGRRVIAIAIAGVALAAAIVLLLINPRTDPDRTIATDDPTTHDPIPEIDPVDPTIQEEIARTEVLEVDFGDNSGAIFAVEDENGDRYAVVWLADVQPKPDLPE